MLSNEPLVSVVMPVYNSDEYLAEAIESILDQTFRDFEFIIICDNPTNKTQQIIDNYQKTDNRIIVFYQKNEGLVASLNKGCSVAKGEYIARMDADDISLLQRFEKQILFLERHQNIGIIGTWVNNISDDGSLLKQTNKLPTSPNVLRYFLHFFSPLAHPSIMMRRRIFEKFGPYDVDALHAEDYELWSRIASDTDFSNIPEVLLKHRVHKKSISDEFKNTQNDQACKTKFFLINKLLNGSVDAKEIRMLHDWQRLKKVSALYQVDVIDSLIHRIFCRVLENNNLNSEELLEIKYYHLMFLFELAISTKNISIIAAIKIIYKMMNENFLLSIKIYLQFLKKILLKF